MVAAVFGIAGVIKLIQPGSFAAELADYELVPVALLGVTAIVVPVLELGGALLVAIAALHRVGAVVLLVLLVIFTGAVVRNLIRGNRAISCACFGRKSRQLDWSVPTRNAFLAVGLLPCLVWSSAGLTAPAVVVAALACLLAWLAIETIRLLETFAEASG